MVLTYLHYDVDGSLMYHAWEQPLHQPLYLGVTQFTSIKVRCTVAIYSYCFLHKQPITALQIMRSDIWRVPTFQ